MSELETRIARLEAIEAIKKLKAHYWHACDRKDVEAVRECFLEGPVEIHYDGPVGLVKHRDGLYEVFKDVACHTEIVEMHHGGPPQIEVVNAQFATGTWGLVYHLLNTEHETLSVVGGYYTDEYRLVDSGWKVAKTRFRTVSVVTWGLRDGIKILHRGSQLPSP